MRRKSADFLEDFAGMRRSSLDMLQDALMGEEGFGMDTGNSEDFINMTASVAASIDPIPFRKNQAIPPVTRDNFKDAPNYTNYTGTSSTDSRAVSNEMINMLANGVIEDPLSAFPADSGNPYSTAPSRSQRHNNPVAPVAAQFLNKLQSNGVGASGPQSHWKGAGLGPHATNPGAQRRRSSGNKHKLVAIAPNSGQWTSDMPVAPPPMRKKQVMTP